MKETNHHITGSILNQTGGQYLSLIMDGQVTLHTHKLEQPDHYIKSAEGRVLDVTFMFDDGTILNKKLDLQPIGYDAVDEEGRPTVLKRDPLDDVKGYMESWMQAYLRGKEDEAKTVDTVLLNKKFAVEDVTSK